MRLKHNTRTSTMRMLILATLLIKSVVSVVFISSIIRNRGYINDNARNNNDNDSDTRSDDDTDYDSSDSEYYSGDFNSNSDSDTDGDGSDANDE